ncbi:MAG: hypothetical protein A2X86_07505 [Bdellovibrionales bacterium GWA2_49_15]|nr:MAG: hypothetical protein A2X86_07505 [Bdellovibrionales bacterium GWA2_49_15]HAZ11876.1 hypothetical protein [Bdellovibrionales bacterium]
MSGLSKNLTIALFLLFVLSIRTVIAGDCRPQDSLQFSEKVFCTVRSELWLIGATSSFNNHHDVVQNTTNNYPEELTRPLGNALWPPHEYRGDRSRP